MNRMHNLLVCRGLANAGSLDSSGTFHLEICKSALNECRKMW
ncbi:hypothetical protein [Bacillus spizizenii]|nr:hypothetical protein [Bacillus spizizenii]MEC1526849.1 hypothetical protein [Bacillus spizizenii]